MLCQCTLKSFHGPTTSSAFELVQTRWIRIYVYGANGLRVTVRDDAQFTVLCMKGDLEQDVNLLQPYRWLLTGHKFAVIFTNSALCWEQSSIRQPKNSIQSHMVM